MRIVATANCDTSRGQALFRGQEYDLPPDVAQPLIDAGKAESAEPKAKAVDGPPENKAVKSRRKKAEG